MTEQEDALVIVDAENCFMFGGPLAVVDGDLIVPVANKLISQFDIVVASRDWHDEEQVSFAINHEGAEPFGTVTLPNGFVQRVWPVHGVKNTLGAEFHPDLDLAAAKKLIVINKGINNDADSPSAFLDDLGRKSGLEDQLRALGVTTLYIMGLATDYCVLFTVLHAIEAGFMVYVIVDGCRGIDAADTRAAIEKMEKAGAVMVHSDKV